MNRTKVISSNIASIGYENGTLEVEFNNGKIYRYAGIPEHLYLSLLSAPSKGTYFAQNIRNRYRGFPIR